MPRKHANRAEEDYEIDAAEGAPESERLQRVLASRGIASRRASETMITEGRVSVNGAVVRELGTKVERDPEGKKLKSVS